MSERPTPRRTAQPKVVVTRPLLPSVETRMSELFDTALNREDVPMSREALVAAVQRAVPHVTGTALAAEPSRGAVQRAITLARGAGVPGANPSASAPAERPSAATRNVVEAVFMPLRLGRMA